MSPARLLLATLLLAAPGSASAGPLARAPYLQSVTPDSAVVCWSTHAATDGFVRFGLAPRTLDHEIADAGSGHDHAVKLTGLAPSTRYFYAVGAGTAILAGGAGELAFVTAPPFGAIVPTRAWILGDSGSADSGARRVRDAFVRFSGARGADFWLMLGDNAYESGTSSEYRAAVFKMYRPMLGAWSLWPTFGNHDDQSADASDESGPYFDVFHLPQDGQAGGAPSSTEAYYSFDEGDLHFICLDSASKPVGSGDAMISWLDDDLAQARADGRRWLIAFWHHAPYSKGTHDSDDEPWMRAMREVVVPRLEAGGVDLVLCGHSHDYERSMLIDRHYGIASTFAPSMVVDAGDGRLASDGGDGAYRKPTLGLAPHEGAVYVVLGCSGKLESGGDLDHPAMIVNQRRLGSLVLDAHASQLDARFLGDDGREHDRFTIVKGAAAAVPIEHSLIAKKSAWRYFDQGADLGAAWTAIAFDDSSWPTAPGVLGYGSPLVDSHVGFGPDAKHKFVTTYFRRAFDLPFDPAAVESLRATVRADDGFVLWLNGVEVARRAFRSGATIDFDTLSKNHSAKRPVTIEIGEHKEALVEGTNVLAIEVHQSRGSSKDLAFDAALEADAFVPR